MKRVSDKLPRGGHSSSEVANSIQERLLPFGFRRAPGRTQKLIKRINDETELFLYPGVTSTKDSIVVDPVIGIYNTSLRARAAVLDGPWTRDPRVCHAFLGILDTWKGGLAFKKTAPMEPAIETVVTSVRKVGVPVMSAFDSTAKVRKLLEDNLTSPRRGPPEVVVLFAAEKLAALSTS